MTIYLIGGIFGGLISGIESLLHALTHPLNFIAKEIGNGVTTVITALGKAMASSSQVTFGTRYVALFDLGFHLAIIIAIGALLYGAAAAALSGEIKRLVDTVVRVVFAIIGSFALLTLVILAQTAIFHIDQGIATTFSSSNQQVGAGLAASLAAVLAASVISGVGAAIAIALGVLAIIGGLILWSVLLMSTAILYIACFFGPLAFVVSAKAGKKVLELIVAMLLVPFVITSVIAIGIAIMLDGGGLARTVPHFIMGVGLLYVAIFSPLALLRFMPLAESHIAQLRHPHQAVQTAADARNSFGGGKSSGGSKPGAKGGSAAVGDAYTEAGAGASAGGIAAVVAAGKAAKGAADKATVGTMGAANDTTSGTDFRQAPQYPTNGAAKPSGQYSGAPQYHDYDPQPTPPDKPAPRRIAKPPQEKQT